MDNSGIKPLRTGEDIVLGVQGNFYYSHNSSAIPRVKHLQEIVWAGYKGELFFRLDDVMSSRQLTTLKRYLKSGIITAERGWPAQLARLAFTAAGHSYLLAPSRSDYKRFTFSNCTKESPFVESLSAQLITLLHLTLSSNIPLATTEDTYNRVVTISFDWEKAMDMLAGSTGTDLPTKLYGRYQGAATLRDRFNRGVNHALINKYMKQGIADARKALGLIAPEIPKTLTIRIE